MLGMNFIGLSYLLVYVGAVSILFLFILMLINVRISELTSDSSNSIPLGIIIGVFFNITFSKLLPSNITSPNLLFFGTEHEKKLENMGMLSDGQDRKEMENDIINILYPLNKPVNSIYNNDLSFVTSQMWDGVLAESSHITSIGNIIYTSYPLWLILTSLILLLAMVGAIVITIKQ